MLMLCALTRTARFLLPATLNRRSTASLLLGGFENEENRSRTVFTSSILGAYRDIDFSSISKQHHFIEETLRSKFESYYKPNIDDWNSTKNSKEYEKLHSLFRIHFSFFGSFSLALICALATYLKRCDIKKCGNIPLEKIPKFFDREQRRLLGKLPRATQAKKVSDSI